MHALRLCLTCINLSPIRCQAAHQADLLTGLAIPVINYYAVEDHPAMPAKTLDREFVVCDYLGYLCSTTVVHDMVRFTAQFTKKKVEGR